jgi:LacI family transcriptional regulator
MANHRSAPTLAQLAAAAGVSAMTASRALSGQPGVSEETRAAIRKLAGEMGYETNRVARKLVTGASRVIGVLASGLDTPFVAALVTAIARAAAAARHDVLIDAVIDYERRPAGGVLQLLQQFTDGVVAVLPYELGYVQALSQARIPVLTIDHPRAHAEFPSIAADSYGGARAAMAHLAELGHRRVAFVGGAPELQSAHDRRRAYDDAVAVLGFARDDRLVLEGDYTLEGGRRAAEEILKLRKRPTAVFAANDLSAFGLMAVLQQRGLRVPEDISVIGFDDLPAAAQWHPALTTVRQPIDELGRAAVNTLLALISGLGAPATQVTLPTELVVRDSTSAPSDQGRR